MGAAKVWYAESPSLNDLWAYSLDATVWTPSLTRGNESRCYRKGPLIPRRHTMPIHSAIARARMSKSPLRAYLKESGLDMAGHVAVDLGSRHCEVRISCSSCSSRLLGVEGGDWR